ncbi:MAG: hypothetical protein HYT16_00400 [DPANN group archaeon]|nr:hypothetical protein [DPANN group archaeon]
MQTRVSGRDLYDLLRQNLSAAVKDGGVTGMLNYLSTLVLPSANYAVLLASAAKSALRRTGSFTIENAVYVDKIISSAVSPQDLLELARGT